MQFGEMRRNYAFLRASNNTAIQDLDSQLVLTVNLNDASWLAYLSIDYQVTKNLIAGVYGLLNVGKKDSEYGMQYLNTVGLLIRYYFTVPNIFKSEKKGQSGRNAQPIKVASANEKEIK